jgi:TetR/AcrR family acrAB operon transcriptional repressor
VVAFRREQVLDAAHTVFARKGFRAATVDEIAAAAGVAKGTVYLYFKSKEEVYWATLDRGLDALFAQTRAAVDRASGTRGKLRAFVATRVEFFEADRQFFVVYLDEFGNVSPQRVSARREFRRRRADLVGILHTALEQGVADGEVRTTTLPGLADLIVALTHAVVVRRLQEPPTRSVGEDIDATLDLLWNGLGQH